jgi:ABC-type Co2+ transport system permease subunit
MPQITGGYRSETTARQCALFLAAWGLAICLPAPAYAMHIAEGIITGWPALAYTLIGLGLMGVGARGIQKFQGEFPDRRPLIGMGAAIIFFISLIPVPAFTGTTSHPCGTPLVAILLGPRVTIMARRMGLPILAAGCAGGLVGDVATYAFSGIVLATALATAPHPQYEFGTYLAVIYGAYAPTQVPIAIGEMLITGLALRHALRQRPEVLEDLKVWQSYAPA